MDVKHSRPPLHGAAEDPQRPAGVAALDALLDALPAAAAVRRRPVVRLAPGRAPAVAAERFAVPLDRLVSELGPAVERGDADLLRHAADRIAARLPSDPAALRSAPARAPVLLPLPLRHAPARAPRPGLVGVLPLAAAASGAPSLAERRAELAALGWRLGVGGMDAAALRFLDLRALAAAADLLLVRWSPVLARREGALRGADPQALVLTGCGSADAIAWGRDAGLLLFCGSAAEALLPTAAAAEAAP